MMDQHRLNLLFEKYQQGTLSPLEEEELNDWFHSLNLGGTEFETWIAQAGGPQNYSEKRLESFRAHIKTLQKPTKTISLWPRIAAAASILLFLSAGGYFFLHKAKPQQQIAQTQKPDLQPGSKKAILLLSGGKVINIGDAKTGTIATQGNTNIIKTADNKIVYSNAATQTTEFVYNTIITKRGNYYPLTMSDGTVAILDAASSIKYPVNFSGNERRVEITGQVYFEVAHNAKMPFRVTVKGQTIEDLGTHFNINAYDDEPSIKTTLLEGSVRINDRVTLKPGQQAVIRANTLKVENVNPEYAVAWTKGYFLFDNETLEEAMLKIGRWYNVQVIYDDPALKEETLFGTISRFGNISQVFKMIERADVIRFNIEGSTVHVKRKKSD